MAKESPSPTATLRQDDAEGSQKGHQVRNRKWITAREFLDQEYDAYYNWLDKNPPPPCKATGEVAVPAYFPKMEPLPPGYIDEVVYRLTDATKEFL